jgi:alcohol dehydrogenase class IV
VKPDPGSSNPPDPGAHGSGPGAGGAAAAPAADRWVAQGFDWRDGERLIRFGPGAVGTAGALLTALSLRPYALLTTGRAAAQAPGLVAAAAVVLVVPPGPVPAAASAVAAEAQGYERTGRAHALVALGGGRVIDAAKAIAAANGIPCAAVPTTLSGAELSRAHRTLPGYERVPPVRPALVVSDPALSASQPLPGLAASAMNALGHAFEALYAPGTNPVAEAAALRAARSLAAGLAGGEPDRGALALGALLAGYAIGATGMALHHVLCQTIVAVSGAPHAQTNAVMLPRTVAFVAARLPRIAAPFADALAGGFAAAGVRRPLGQSAPDAARLVTELAARAEVPGLATLGVARAQLRQIASAAAARASLPRSTVSEAEIAAMLDAAF